ncbi:MAG: ABC transporter substrate-binding protein [Rhodoluna sp.]
MSKIKSLVAVAVTAGLVMTGASATQAATKTLTLGSVADVVSFAAAQAEGGNRVWYYQAVYDTLLKKKEDASLIPGLASSWKYNADQTVLTLNLRPGQKFTDGTAEDAKAVVKNLVANRDSKGPNANYLASMKTAVAKNATTVVITLTDNDPAFLENLSESAGTIESPKLIGTSADKTKPVGAGPYLFNAKASKFGDHYTFTKNAGYWDAKNVTYDTVTVKYIQDGTAMVNALQTGAVKGANVAVNSSVPTLKAAGLKFVSSYLDCLGIYLADRTGAQGTPLKSLKVRQAMNMVFDRAAMLKAIDNGQGKVTEQYFPSANKAYDASLNSTYKFDVAAAQKLMDDAGYSKGFTLAMPTLAFYFGDAAYAVIKAQLAKINITVKEEPQTGATFIGDIMAPKWPAYLMQFERSVNTWKMLNFMVTDNSLFNNDKFTSSAVSSLIGRYQGASDDKTRLALAKKINTALVQEAWFIPFYEKQSNFAFKGIQIKSAQAGNVIPFLYNIH